MDIALLQDTVGGLDFRSLKNTELLLWQLLVDKFEPSEASF